MDPKVIALDIETFGICRKGWYGRDLPPQRYFHPAKCLAFDGVHPDDLIITVSITLPTEDPRWFPKKMNVSPSVEPTTSSGMTTNPNMTEGSNCSVKVSGSPDADSSPSKNGWPSWTASGVSQLQPGETMVFQMGNQDHRKMLKAWLKHADTLILKNGLFDLLWLRALPEYAPVIHERRHFILELDVFNYMQCEVRPERSLKDIGPILNTHIYKGSTAKNYRWDTPTSVDRDGRTVSDYNAEDSHNTLVCVAELARLTLAQWKGSQCHWLNASITGCLEGQPPRSSGSPSSDQTTTSTPAKLSEYCLGFYNGVIWAALRKIENGIPMDRGKLHSIESLLLRKCEIARRYLAGRWGLHMDNTLCEAGCQKTQQDFLTAVIQEVDKCRQLKRGGPSGSPSGSLPCSSLSSPVSSVISEPLFQCTETKGQPSWSDQNRDLLAGMLPDQHPMKAGLHAASIYSKAQKLISDYTYPLLRRKRTISKKKGVERHSVLIPHGKRGPFTPTEIEVPSWNPLLYSAKPSSLSASCSTCPDSPKIADDGVVDCNSPVPLVGDDIAGQIGVGYPSVYVVPSTFADTTDHGGGQLQVRPSFKDPKAQTFPKVIKSCYASRFGRDGCIVSYDLSQIELRTAGLLSGEPSIVSAYQEGRDLHDERAIAVFTPLFGPVNQAWSLRENGERSKWGQCAKHSNFADLYGAGPDKLQSLFLKKSGVYIDIDVCEHIVRGRSRLRPVLVQWQQNLIETTKAAGYVMLPFTGHSRYFMGGLDYDANEILNFPVQSVAAATLHAISARIHARLNPLANPVQPILPFLNVYDAEYFDVRLSNCDYLTNLINEAVKYVETTGYWSMWQNLLGRAVPLKHDITIHRKET